MIKYFKSIFICCIGPLVLIACAHNFKTPNASGHYASKPLQCVPFARSASGIQLYGDAYTWWDQAALTHPRGTIPMPGAVLVLAQTERMTHGHLAVVKRVIDNRQVDVTHSNWGNNWSTRRIIYDLVRAIDVSPYNDWTQVKFWNHEQNCFGSPYQAMGFIYK